MSLIDEARLEKLLAPISDDAPCGEAPVDTTGMHEIDRQLDRARQLGSLTKAPPGPGGEPAREEMRAWQRLAEDCLVVMEREGKGLILPIQAAEAWIAAGQGIAGVHAALQLVRGLLSRHWDSVHPLRIDQRADVLKDFPRLRDKGLDISNNRELANAALVEIDEIESIWKSRHPDAQFDPDADPDAAIAARNSIKPVLDEPRRELRTMLGLDNPAPTNGDAAEEDGGPAPLDFSALEIPDVAAEDVTLLAADTDLPPERALEAEGTASAPDIAPDAGSSLPAGNGAEGAVPAPASYRGPSIAVGADADQTALRNQLAVWAIKRRRADSRDPDAYAVLRTASVIGIGGAAEVEACLGTAWAPQAAARERLANLATSANQLALLEESETALARSPLWLDAHRYTAEALEALGSDHAAARDVAVGHLRYLLTRFPDLPSKRFGNGVAVAETATQAWLQNRTGDLGQHAGGFDHAALRALATAEQLAERNNDAEGGLQLLAHGLRAAWGKRERMLWNVALVRFLLRLKRHDLAEALMKEVDDAAKSISDDWEPQCMALIQESKLELLQSKQSKSSTHDKDRSDILNTLARLDPGRAFRLVKQSQA